MSFYLSGGISNKWNKTSKIFQTCNLDILDSKSDVVIAG